jgi:hypothetical protein
MYVGLLDEKGKELHAPSYHRLSMHDVHFKLSPPEDPYDDVTIVNTTEIGWTAKEVWPPIRAAAYYHEVDDQDPFYTTPMSTNEIRPWDQVVFFPGKLRIGTRLRKRNEHHQVDSAQR